MRATQYNPVITDYGRSFPFYVCTIGTAQRQKPVYRRDGLQDDQILYTVRGEGRAEVGGETCILRPRTILNAAFLCGKYGGLADEMDHFQRRDKSFPGQENGGLGTAGGFSF